MTTRTFSRTLPAPHGAAPLALLLALLLILGSAPFVRPAPIPAPAPAPVAPPHVLDVQPAQPELPQAAASATPQLLSRPEIVERREEFARHYDLGGGHAVAIVGLEPLNYRDADGNWQPIQPEFAPVASGWQVAANSLRSRLPARGTAVELEANGARIGWQPQALQVQAADGQTRELAAPLPLEGAPPGVLADKGRTLRYTGAWSNPSLVEQLRSSAGKIEQELVLAERPTAMAGAEWLELRAELALPPGAQVFADGTLHDGEVTTAGPIEIRDAQGTTLLVFVPPAAYEQGNPLARAAGRYHLLRQGQTATLTVQTPWAWWADPARQFPAVLDPAMQVLMYSQGAHIDNQLDGFTDPDFPDLPEPVYSAFAGGDVRAGHYVVNPSGFPNGYQRGYVKFPLPVLPPDTTPSYASLVAAPINYSSLPTYDDQPTYVYQMTEDWSYLLQQSEPLLQNSLQPFNDYPEHAPSGELALIRKGDPTKPNGPLPATQWNVTPVVQGWYAGGPNYGFGLQLEAEQHALFEGTLSNGRHPVVTHFPSEMKWTNLDNVVNAPDPASATVDGPGLGLLVYYDSTMLTSNTELVNLTVPSSLPTNTFKDQYHEYNVESPAGRWRFVAAHGQPGDGSPEPPPIPILPTNENDPAARVPLDLVSGDSLLSSSKADRRPSDPQMPDGDLFPWDLSYVVINGHQPLPGDLRVRVKHDDNNNLPEWHNHKRYQLQVNDALPPPPPFPIGQQITVTLPFSTGIAFGQELALEENTTVEIQIPYPEPGPSLANASSVEQAVEPLPPGAFDAQVFKPSLLYGSRSEQGMRLIQGPDAYEIEFPVRAGQAGNWLLLLNSNVRYAPTEIVARVTVCQNTADTISYPINGQCVELRRPPGLPDDTSTYKQNTEAYKEIGNLRFYNPAGFEGNCDVECTPRQKTTDGVAVMPLIGFAGDDLHWAALKGGGLRITSSAITTTLDTRVLLVDFSDMAEIATLPVLWGAFDINRTNGLMTLTEFGAPQPLLVNSPAKTDDGNGAGANGWRYEIDLDRAVLHASGPLQRKIQPTPDKPSATFAFTNAEWSITVAGAASLAGEVPVPAFSTEVGEPFIRVGTLQVTPPADDRYTFEIDPRALPKDGGPTPLPQFAQIRVTGLTIALPPNLGGSAVYEQQALIFPPSDPVKDETGNDIELFRGPDPTFSAFDLRGPNDAMGAAGPQVDRQYDMPDLIVTGKTGTVLINSAAGVDVYSRDHPDAVNGLPDIPFDYEAIGAQVKTFYGPCPVGSNASGGGNITTVIEGTLNGPSAFIRLPSIGRADDTDPDDPGTEIFSATFTLCENALRELKFEFNTHDVTAIPLGPTPLFLHMIHVEITIAPSDAGGGDFVQVELDAYIRAPTAPAAGSNLFSAVKVLIDTRGLFDIQAHVGVKVFGDVGAAMDGHFWVAWNPLDVGFNIGACAPYTGGYDPAAFPKISSGSIGAQNQVGLCKGDEILFGQLYAHLWKGAGWNNAYPWITDNNLHIAAKFNARFNLPEGLLVDWGPVQVPPDDITLFEITLAFGEFCSNNSCTEFEWGVLGSFSVFGYDVGLFFGFDSGINFILGSSDYTLLDGTSVLAATSATDQGLEATDVITTVTVAEGVPSVMFGLAWPATPLTPPRMLLRDPLGRDIDPEAPPPGLTVTSVTTPTATSGQQLLVVQNPPAGEWQVTIERPSPSESFRFFHLANRPPPQIEINILGQPAPDAETVPISYRVTGLPPDSNTHLSLYYELMEPTSPLTAAQEVQGPVYERIPLESSPTGTAEGQINWAVAHLPTGDYQVFGRLDTGAGIVVHECRKQLKVPNDEVRDMYNPDPEQQECGTMLNPTLMLTDKAIDTFAPTAVSIVNGTPPDAPGGVALQSAGASSVTTTWEPSDSKDVIGYVVTCAQGEITRQVRVLARHEAGSNEKESLQVNGFNPDAPVTCTVQAYDVSSNLSEPSKETVSTTAPPCARNPEADLSGTLVTNSQGKVTNRSKSCVYDIGLAIYRKFDDVTDHQALFDSATARIGPGQTAYLNVKLPDCAAQVDLFYGPVLTSLDGQRYGERLLAFRHIGGENYCTPDQISLAPPSRLAAFASGRVANLQRSRLIAKIT